MAAYGADISAIKLAVYFKNGNLNVFYSYVAEEKFGIEILIKKMVTRILIRNKNIYGKYANAFFFNNKTGELIEYWKEGTNVPCNSQAFQEAVEKFSQTSKR